jgi:hypothetical protein
MTEMEEQMTWLQEEERSLILAARELHLVAEHHRGNCAVCGHMRGRCQTKLLLDQLQPTLRRLLRRNQAAQDAQTPLPVHSPVILS